MVMSFSWFDLVLFDFSLMIALVNTIQVFLCQPSVLVEQSSHITH